MKQQHTDIRYALAQVRMKHAVPLIVVACLVQLLLSSQVLAAHPLLVEGLTAFGPVCTVLGLVILLLVSLRFVVDRLTAGSRRLKKMGQRGARRVRTVIFGIEEQSTYVSREDVQQVWKYQLHLSQALFRIASEKMQAPYAQLLAEYDGQVRLLRHLGFPELELKPVNLTQVRLSQHNFTFVRQWQASLYARLYQTQQHVQTQQETAQTALFAVQALLEALSLHPAAQDEPGYHRVLGSYELLTRLAKDRRTPPEVALAYAQELRRTMEMVREHLDASRLQTPGKEVSGSPEKAQASERQNVAPQQQTPVAARQNVAPQPQPPVAERFVVGFPERHNGARKRPRTEKLNHRPS